MRISNFTTIGGVIKYPLFRTSRQHYTGVNNAAVRLKKKKKKIKYKLLLYCCVIALVTFGAAVRESRKKSFQFGNTRPDGLFIYYSFLYRLKRLRHGSSLKINLHVNKYTTFLFTNAHIRVL